jgi:hypothetical protein
MPRSASHTETSHAPSYFEGMRSAILQLPDARTANEQRQVLRAAIRQLERAEIYLAAVDHMELEDRAARRAIRQLRSDIGSLRLHLGEERNRILS